MKCDYIVFYFIWSPLVFIPRQIKMLCFPENLVLCNNFYLFFFVNESFHRFPRIIANIRIYIFFSIPYAFLKVNIGKIEIKMQKKETKHSQLRYFLLDVLILTLKDIFYTIIIAIRLKIRIFLSVLNYKNKLIRL